MIKKTIQYIINSRYPGMSWNQVGVYKSLAKAKMEFDKFNLKCNNFELIKVATESEMVSKK